LAVDRFRPRILVLFATFDGHTAKVAERIAQTLRATGHVVTLRPANAIEVIWELDTHDGIIVGAAIRYGHHPAYLVELIREHIADLLERPNAFYSVCLSAGGPGARPATAQSYVDAFIRRTGWRPGLAQSFAGALRYSRYNPFIRFMMRLIVGMAGGDTDTSRDYEYTDWAAVDRFAVDFATQLVATHPAK
jgi:menaquinone-dependent protoporphyrinogen oxidase